MTSSVDRLVPFNEAAKIRGISRSTQYEYVSDGTISPPRKMGKKLRGWLESELMEELRALPAEMPTRVTHLNPPKPKQSNDKTED